MTSPPAPLLRRGDHDPDASKHFCYRIINVIFFAGLFTISFAFSKSFNETASPFIVYSKGEGSLTLKILKTFSIGFSKLIMVPI